MNFSLADIASDLDALIVAIRPAPRVEACARELRDALAAIQAGDQIVGAEAIRRLALSLSDATMCLQTWKTLGGRPDLRKRLRQAFDGTSVLVPQRDNDDGRDRLWEVFAAACLAQGGFAPVFADTLIDKHVSQPDLFVDVQDCRLAVEAKRIRSAGGLTTRVKKAVGQVANACQAGHALGGFLVIDLGFSVGQHAQLGIWTLANESSLEHVRQQLEPELRQLGIEVLKTIEREPGARYVAGASLMVTPALRYADKRQLGSVRYFINCSITGREQRILDAYNRVHATCFGDGVQ